LIAPRSLFASGERVSASFTSESESLFFAFRNTSHQSGSLFHFRFCFAPGRGGFRIGFGGGLTFADEIGGSTGDS